MSHSDSLSDTKIDGAAIDFDRRIIWLDPKLGKGELQGPLPAGVRPEDQQGK